MAETIRVEYIQSDVIHNPESPSEIISYDECDWKSFVRIDKEADVKRHKYIDDVDTGGEASNEGFGLDTGKRVEYIDPVLGHAKETALSIENIVELPTQKAVTAESPQQSLSYDECDWKSFIRIDKEKDAGRHKLIDDVDTGGEAPGVIAEEEEEPSGVFVKFPHVFKKD